MTISEYIILSLFVVMGLFTTVCALLNVEWFFTNRRAATFVNWFGRQGARLFYAILGLALIICGVTGFLTWE